MRTGLQFLHGLETPSCTAIVDKRFIGYSTLQFVCRGGVELRYNSKQYQLQAPAIWPCHPGPHIYFKAIEESWHHFYIAVTGPLLDEWRRDGLWPEQPLAVLNPEKLRADWTLLLKLFHEPDQWQQQRAINLLEQILLDLLPADASGPEAAWLQSAKKDLERGYDQSACARKLKMGISTFRRRFTEACGICPQDWLVQQRIDQARELLLNSDMPVAEIGAQLQYCDAAHFARQFKLRVGLSPRSYRQSRNQ